MHKVLTRDIQVRCRELLIEICEAENVDILKVVVRLDHIEYAPKQSISYIVKELKRRSSRKL